MVENFKNNKESVEAAFQHSPDLIAQLEKNKSENESAAQAVVNAVMMNPKSFASIKDALGLKPLKRDEMYQFMLGLDPHPVKVDGNIHAFVDGRWVHIKSPKDMINLLRSTEATSVFELLQFPGEHVDYLMERAIVDTGEYDRNVIDF